MNENRSLFTKVWYILYPFLFYYAVMLILMTVAQWIFGSGNEQFVLCQLVSTLFTIPFLLPFYRQDQAMAGIVPGTWRPTKQNMSAAGISVLIAACIGVGLNNIISMTELVNISAGYQEANAGFYGSTLVLELISSALFTPVLEELVFRGIIFGRMRKMMPKIPAILLSSAVFAVMHFNIVQFLYALLVGIVLALLMERGGHVGYVMLGHMTVNFIAVIRTETGFLARTVAGDVFSWAVSVCLLLVGLALLGIYCMAMVQKKR